MGDDFGDGGDFGDFGNGGGDGGDDGGYDDQDDGQDNGGPDDQGGDDQSGDDDQNGGDDQSDPDQDGGDDGDNLDDMFASGDDLPPVDDDVFGSAADFPNADAADFQDDEGDWSAADYQQSAENLFGDHPFFGDTLIQQKIDEGFQPYEDNRFDQAFDQMAPGTSDTVQLFEREGKLLAFGVVSQAVLEMLMARYTGIDWNNLEVAVPPKGDAVPPQPLPPAFANVAEQEAVDLRKYSTPIGDQGQTGRCSAFAWTHAIEMSRNILKESHLDCRPISPCSNSNACKVTHATTSMPTKAATGLSVAPTRAKSWSKTERAVRNYGRMIVPARSRARSSSRLTPSATSWKAFRCLSLSMM